MLSVKYSIKEIEFKSLIASCYEIVRKCDFPHPDECFDYLSVVRNPVPEPLIEVGVPRKHGDKLRGMRFLLLGTYLRKTQSELTTEIETMGGCVIDYGKAETILRNHTAAPHFYVVLENDETLRCATDAD